MCFNYLYNCTLLPTLKYDKTPENQYADYCDFRNLNITFFVIQISSHLPPSQVAEDHNDATHEDSEHRSVHLVDALQPARLLAL